MNTQNFRLQYAALPFRRCGEVIEVLLVTSRESSRWVIPKGWPIEGLAPHDAAAREAREEAGLVGRISNHAVGRFHYDKRLGDGSTVACEVEVFPLEVERQMKLWPEREERRRRWFGLEEGAKAVQEPELQTLIRDLARDFGCRAI